MEKKYVISNIIYLSFKFFLISFRFRDIEVGLTDKNTTFYVIIK